MAVKKHSAGGSKNPLRGPVMKALIEQPERSCNSIAEEFGVPQASVLRWSVAVEYDRRIAGLPPLRKHVSPLTEARFHREGVELGDRSNSPKSPADQIAKMGLQTSGPPMSEKALEIVKWMEDNNEGCGEANRHFGLKPNTAEQYLAMFRRNQERAQRRMSGVATRPIPADRESVAPSPVNVAANQANLILLNAQRTAPPEREVREEFKEAVTGAIRIRLDFLNDPESIRLERRSEAAVRVIAALADRFPNLVTITRVIEQDREGEKLLAQLTGRSSSIDDRPPLELVDSSVVDSSVRAADSSEPDDQAVTLLDDFPPQD